MQNIEIMTAIGRRLTAITAPQLVEPLPSAMLLALSRLEHLECRVAAAATATLESVG
jgi:hypothetical protein